MENYSTFFFKIIDNVYFYAHGTHILKAIYETFLCVISFDQKYIFKHARLAFCLNLLIELLHRRGCFHHSKH